MRAVLCVVGPLDAVFDLVAAVGVCVRSVGCFASCCSGVPVCVLRRFLVRFLLKFVLFVPVVSVCHSFLGTTCGAGGFLGLLDRIVLIVNVSCSGLFD